MHDTSGIITAECFGGPLDGTSFYLRRASEPGLEVYSDGEHNEIHPKRHFTALPSPSFNLIGWYEWAGPDTWLIWRPSHD